MDERVSNGFVLIYEPGIFCLACRSTDMALLTDTNLPDLGGGFVICYKCRRVHHRDQGELPVMVLPKEIDRLSQWMSN
jgi:hypothetical protein